MCPIDYYLDESRGWALSVTELKRAIDEARLACNPRAIVVINPGNPTGKLTRGLRGGYCEIVNMDPAVQGVLTASIAAKLCPTVLGQAAVDCIVDPPKSFHPSHTLFHSEKREILQNLADKANLVYTSLKMLPGIEFQPIEGAMYAFPKVILPVNAVEAAVEMEMEPDVFYAMALLEETGVSVVPGSGMGQVEGTYHFRTTLLPSMNKLKIMMSKFQEFHLNFMNRYA